MTTAFISYAREDRAFVDYLIGALHAHGITSAWDQDHNVVPFSAPWREEIEAGIRASDKFVFVISPDSIASVPCGTELTLGAGAGQADHPDRGAPAGRRRRGAAGARRPELDLLRRP